MHSGEHHYCCYLQMPIWFFICSFYEFLPFLHNLSVMRSLFVATSDYHHLITSLTVTERFLSQSQSFFYFYCKSVVFITEHPLIYVFAFCWFRTKKICCALQRTLWFTLEMCVHFLLVGQKCLECKLVYLKNQNSSFDMSKIFLFLFGKSCT